MDFPRDPKDANFLAWAIARDADFLITGDRDLNQIREVRQTTIISGYSFNDLFIDQAMGSAVTALKM